MAYLNLRTSFAGMTWAPDVPSNQQAENQYGSGRNIEVNTAGLGQVTGEEPVLSEIPGVILHITGGFRFNNLWSFVIITRDPNNSNTGRFWLVTSSAAPSDITPPGFARVYSDDTNFTTDWLGTTLFINDGLDTPLYLLQNQNSIAVYPTAMWNYLPGVDVTRTNFLRVFNSPNLGSILVAGGLTQSASGIDTVFPTTLRWSTPLAQNGEPTGDQGSFVPDLFNTANELEVPARGELLDGFHLNGQFYIMSYWDTIVMTPIAYTTSVDPVFATRLFTQGRGLLNNNCWAANDSVVYGVDARDIWVFNGSEFRELGQLRVKNWFYDNLNPAYYQRVFVINNTRQDQIEIYFPSLDSTGYCDKMISYRYDLDVWQPPRDVANAISAIESPKIQANVASMTQRGVVYVQGGITGNTKIVQKDIFSSSTFITGNIVSEFTRENIQFPKVSYSQLIYTHRILPELLGTGVVNVAVGGSSSVNLPTVWQPNISFDLSSNTPWAQIDQNDSRVTSIQFTANNNSNTWQITAVNWQITPVENRF